MKKVFFILFMVQSAWAQNHPSIHQVEYKKHKNIPKQASFFKSSQKIIPLKTRVSEGPSKTVFGYLPDWEYTDAREYLQYDLLSHIAAFDFTVASTGNIAEPSYWPWTDVINKAHENGVKVIMTAVNFTADEIHAILTNSTIKNNFFNQTKTILKTWDLQGVNIDFESLHTADRGAVLNNFMSELTAFIHSEVNGSEISFAGPAVNWGGWDLKGLAASCDYIFIMGYSFAGGWSSKTGANAPVLGGSINITNTLDVQYKDVTGTHPDKLILGVPYYGNRWQTETLLAHSNILDFINSPRFRTAQEESIIHEKFWDNNSQSPWYRYTENSKYYQVWYDDKESLDLKYNLADNRSLKGVGMWALGYDGARNELWELLRSKYGNPVGILSPDGSDRPEIYQNYPNPFRISSHINYFTPYTGNVSLKIYELSGRMVIQKQIMNQIPGEHSIELKTDQLSPGIYFYQMQITNLQSGDIYQKAFKMQILK